MAEKEINITDKLKKGIKFCDNIETFFFLLVVISVFTMIASIFVFIWATLVLATKIFFTGLFSFIINLLFEKMFKYNREKLQAELKQKEETTV